MFVMPHIYCDGNADALPHPNMDWNAFLAAVKGLVKQQAPVFCPIAQTMKPWVDTALLYKTYAKEIRANGRSNASSCTIS